MHAKDEAHITAVKQAERLFSCKVCKKTLSNEHDYRRHLASQKHKYKCEVPKGNTE